MTNHSDKALRIHYIYVIVNERDDNMNKENTDKKSHRILLVEDNQDDELLALKAIESQAWNTEVVVAHDGVEALDYLPATTINKHCIQKWSCLI